MEQTKITLHRALSEIKLIDAKIEKQILEMQPSGVYQKGRAINNTSSQDDFKKSAESKFDSINALIDRKQKLKSAIVKANSETVLTIAGKQMTIADAITFKSVIVLKKSFAMSLKSKHREATAGMNRANDIVSKNVQALLEAALGKDNVKLGTEDVEAVRKPYLESNEVHLFDPLKIESKIEIIENEISEFESEVDACLSEINAVTFITI